MHITDAIRYVGVNDHDIDLFEGLYPVPDGVSYNSYVILDEKIAVMDPVDQHFGDQWLANVREALDGRTPDYIVVHHMEPDHSANLARFMDEFPGAAVVASDKAFTMMKAYFGKDYAERRVVVREGSTLALGQHTLQFIAAPMVHWPEVMMSYEISTGTLFSADGFGKFGALDAEASEVQPQAERASANAGIGDAKPAAGEGRSGPDWACEARRYYFGIVGKYGTMVQNVLKKAAALKIDRICPLHGPVLEGDMLAEALRLYGIWSSYGVESEGVVVAYASIYGHTADAALALAADLEAKGVKVAVHDLCRTEIYEAVEDAFRYGKLALASVTYNGDVLPPMRAFLHHLSSRAYQKRTIALIEAGSWAPMAAKVMRELLAPCKDVAILEEGVRILGAMTDENRAQIAALANALA
ncbi:MAG: FprA family A-type flavoprotein [Clostridia bacterium]|nr:FprA family A-type flavoprotein [Clostridia bacterium]